MNFAYRNMGHATVPIWQWWLTVIIARWRYWFIRSENHNKKMDDSPGASLGHDDWGVLIFSRRKFTIYPTDGTPASCIPTKPSSQQQGTRDLPDKGDIFFQQHTQQPTPRPPGSENSSANAFECDSQAISFLSIFEKNYHGGVAPPHPPQRVAPTHPSRFLARRFWNI